MLRNRKSIMDDRRGRCWRFSALALWLCCTVAAAEHYTVPLFVPASTSGGPQGVLRILNDGDASGTVTVYAIDDAGTRSGPATFTLNARAAAEFTATDLANGNTASGLTGSLGTGTGEWRLEIETELPIQPMAYVRAADGTLSVMHDTVRGTEVAGQATYLVPVFNPSTEVTQASRLRLINPGDAVAMVTISGRDDTGAAASGGDVQLTLPANGARTLTAQQLEAGDTSVTGRLGAGVGRWRLSVSSDRPIQVVNVAVSSSGAWNNLSTTAVRGPAPADHGAFSERFDGLGAVYETDGGRFTLSPQADDRFTETGEADGMAVSRSGTYRYSGIGPDAGRLRLTYDNGNDSACAANFYFSSRTGGWFASHCTGSDHPDGRWLGGTWYVDDGVDTSPAVAEGGCYVGLMVGIGESCTYPGTEDEFSVNVRGRGRFLDRLAGIRIRIDNETIDGRVYDFEASHQGDGVWRIDRVAGSTEPPSADDVDGDGIPNVSDPDDDNDGTPDADDPCPLDGRNTCDDASSVASLDVSGTMPLTSIGETIQLAATAHMIDGSSEAIASGFVHWVSADPAVATVVDGTVTAVGGGNVRIVATYRGHKAVAQVGVYISVRETGTVRMIYAAPADREFRSDYRDAIRHAIVDLQSWFRQQTGGLTFSLYDATPEQCQLSETADYYDQDTWPKVLVGVQHCAPVQGHTSSFTWVVYADLERVCGARGRLGAGGPGLTMLPREDLEGLIGNKLGYYGVCGGGPWPGPVTRWIGGLGHELGHAFGLLHPPGCDEGPPPMCDHNALIASGYGDYPDSYLRHDDKEALLRSPFVGWDPSHRPLTGFSGDAVAIRATVVDPDGEVVEGMRVSVVADGHWTWDQSAANGTIELRLPASASGSAFLSVHSGAAGGCGWLGYHRAGGLTALRERAGPIELGGTDTTSIEIRLPSFPQKLCTGQRIVSGMVLGPDGEPVELWVGGGLFDTWNWTGPDGRFELRQPELSSVLWINTAQCGNIGYYKDGGVTTRLADAARFGIGGVDDADIQIRLSGTTAELCARQIVISGTVVGPNGDAAEGILVESQPFRRGGSSGPDGAFELRLLEGTTGVAVLAIFATCGHVGYYGPNGFTASRNDATEIEVGDGTVAGIEIRLPVEVDELCGQSSAGTAATKPAAALTILNRTSPRQ